MSSIKRPDLRFSHRGETHPGAKDTTAAVAKAKRMLIEVTIARDALNKIVEATGIAISHCCGPPTAQPGCTYNLSPPK